MGAEETREDETEERDEREHDNLLVVEPVKWFVYEHAEKESVKGE